MERHLIQKMFFTSPFENVKVFNVWVAVSIKSRGGSCFGPLKGSRKMVSGNVTLTVKSTIFLP